MFIKNLIGSAMSNGESKAGETQFLCQKWAQSHVGFSCITRVGSVNV